MKKFEVLLIVFLITFFLGLVIVSLTWRDRSVYDNAYRTKVESAERFRQEMEESGGASASSQKKSSMPYGFRESEIEKHEGDRFRTY